MKSKVLLLFCFFILSCDVILEEIIENSFDNDDSPLTVSIKNNTPYVFERTEVITEGGTVVFQVINPDFYGISEQFPFIYDDIEIQIKTETKILYHKPHFFKNESKETKGRFTFNVNLSEKGELIIERIKH